MCVIPTNNILKRREEKWIVNNYVVTLQSNCTIFRSLYFFFFFWKCRKSCSCHSPRFTFIGLLPKHASFISRIVLIKANKESLCKVINKAHGIQIKTDSFHNDEKLSVSLITHPMTLRRDLLWLCGNSLFSCSFEYAGEESPADILLACNSWFTSLHTTFVTSDSSSSLVLLVQYYRLPSQAVVVECSCPTRDEVQLSLHRYFCDTGGTQDFLNQSNLRKY